LAARLATLDDPALVQEAFLTILGRSPTPAESSACAESLAKLTNLQSAKPDPQRARALFLQALLNHNDFVTLR
jgi:hypothetical protein